MVLSTLDLFAYSSSYSCFSILCFIAFCNSEPYSVIVLCVCEDVVKAAAYLLKFGGRLCICHRPERLADIICDMRAHGIEPKIYREVIQREGEQPWLVLVEGRLGGNKGMTVLPPLYVEKDGLLSDEMMDIYGDYKQGKGRQI